MQIIVPILDTPTAMETARKQQPQTPSDSHPPTGSADARAVRIVLMIAIPLLILWLGFAQFPAPTCWFRSTLGIPCPFCGSVRALRLLCQGRVAEALTLQPLTTLASIFAGLWLLYEIGVATGALRRLSWRFPRRSQRNALVAAVGLAVLVNWIYQILC